MAFGFFRRNEKMVIWVMVALMIAFLLTGVISSLGGSNPWGGGRMSDEVIATFGDDTELTEGERQAALGDLELLRRAGLGNMMRAVGQQMAGSGATSELMMLMLTAQPVVSDGRVVDLRGIEPRQAGKMWAMLLHEARGMGLEIDKPVVDQYLATRLGVTDETLTEYLAGLSDEGTVRPERFREAVGNLLLVSTAFDTVAGGAPAPEAHLRGLFKQQQSRMDVAMLVFRAGDFLDEIPAEPSGEQFEQEIQAMFEAGKVYRRGSSDNPNPFGFGYRLPDQVKVEYAHVPFAEALAAVKPTDKEISDYQEANRDALIEAIRAARAQEAETQPATQPEEVPEYLLKGEARRRLRWQQAETLARTWATDLLTRAQEVAAGQRDDATASPLQAAVEAASADVPVRYEAADEWMGWVDLRQDLVLGAAMTLASQPERLPSVAMRTAELLDESQRSSAATSMGELYPQVMRVYGARSGFLVWRVTDARESSPPAEIDEEIRESLTDDWRSMKAYDLAVGAAEDAIGRLGEASLETIAAEHKMEVQRAEALAQLRIADPLTAARELMTAGYAPADMDRQALQARAAVAELIQSQGESHTLLETVTPEGLATAALQKPFVQFAPPIEPLGAVDEATRKAFLDAVFEMVPAEPSETSPTTSAPAAAEAIRLVKLPGALSVVVAQRVGYTPAYEEDYQAGRGRLMSMLQQMDRQEALWRWMDPAEIEARTGLETVRAAEAE